MKYQTLIMMLACLAHATTFTNIERSLNRRQPAGSPPSSPRQSDTKSKDEESNPVHVSASTQGRAIIHVYRQGSQHTSEEFYNEKGPWRKQFSDPKKISVVVAPFTKGEHTADATGRKVKGMVEPMGSSRGVVSSWSYAAGRKVKETDGLRKQLKAASSRVDAPVSSDGYINGRGTIRMEASNSPSTSPPGSPGRQPVSYPFHPKHRIG